MPGRARLLAFVALAAAAAASWWLAARTDPPGQEAGAPAPGLVDYYVNGLDVTRMTPAGRPANRLRADQLRHLTGAQTTELDQPRLTVFRADGSPPWHIDSQNAEVSADGELVLLQGDVLIERDGDATGDPVRMETRNLRFRPAQDYAETDEKVRVTSIANRITAVGMQAWLRPPSRIKFLSEVEGFYAPR